MSEGLQIHRYTLGGEGYRKDHDGMFCKFVIAEQFHSAAQEAIGKNMILAVERKKMLDLLKGSTTQVICVKCHTMGTYDGKVCSVCGGNKMIKPVRILDHKKVEAIITEAAHADGKCGEGCLLCEEERGGER